MTSAISPAANPSSDADASQAASAPAALPQQLEPRVRAILAALGRAAFVWDIRKRCHDLDRGSRVDLSGHRPGLACYRRRVCRALIEPSGSIRADILWPRQPPAALGEGVPYRIEYGVRASASAPMLWIEESGCWFADADGKAVRVEGIVRLENERRARDEQLVRMSRNDALTGELNRTHLTAALAEAIEEAARYRSSFAFMMVGIDHLARINDAFGFDVADEVIGDVARRIRARLRGGDVLGRFSGNKFGVILKNCTVDDVNVAAERLLAGIRDEIVPTRSGPVSVTASIGAVCAPRYARTADEAINRAQEILETAKSRRSGSFAVWRPDIERDAQRQINIRVTDEIVTALNERRILTAFEPVVDARTREPAFYECLVRMRQQDGQSCSRRMWCRWRRNSD